MDEISRPRDDDAPQPRRRKAKGPAEGLDDQLSGETSAPDLADRGGVTPEPEPEAASRRVLPRIEDGDDDEPAALKDPDEIARVLLAVLLVSKEPVSKLRLAQVCNASQQDVAAGLERLEEQLRELGFPIEVSRLDTSARLLTLPEVFPYLKRLRKVKKAERLSPAALETLAVVAYRQPVMRAEIEAIRGVKVGPTLHTLLEHKLVDVVGRADVPGRPLQYGTTQNFLDRFGVASTKDLPSVKEFKSLGS